MHYRGVKMYGGRRFNRVAQSLWNKLPVKLRKIFNLKAFKTELETHLFFKSLPARRIYVNSFIE